MLRRKRVSVLLTLLTRSRVSIGATETMRRLCTAYSGALQFRWPRFGSGYQYYLLGDDGYNKKHSHYSHFDPLAICLLQTNATRLVQTERDSEETMNQKLTCCNFYSMIFLFV
uniref:Putative secreted protein n=1 Tax=Anopheles darlingi TaxID=43151 RepID=A0A2M4D4K1_ANODA